MKCCYDRDAKLNLNGGKMEEEQKSMDWRDEISEPKDILKVEPEKEVVFTFQDEGILRNHPEFGNAVTFGVLVEGEEKTKVWYVNSKNFDLLGQIKALGLITNMKVRVKRTGSRRSDTRYTIAKI